MKVNSDLAFTPSCIWKKQRANNFSWQISTVKKKLFCKCAWRNMKTNKQKYPQYLFGLSCYCHKDMINKTFLMHKYVVLWMWSLVHAASYLFRLCFMDIVYMCFIDIWEMYRHLKQRPCLCYCFISVMCNHCHVVWKDFCYNLFEKMNNL